MLELAKPCKKIWLEPNNNPKRKLKYSWKLIEIDNTFIGVDTNYANKVVKEVISLPMHSELEENQIDYISGSIKSFFKNK